MYYDVREIVERGRGIGAAGKKRPPVKTDDVLVGVVYCNHWAMAPDVTTEFDYLRFFEDYEDGIFRRMELYLISRDEIKNCTDKGRVRVEELEKILKNKT